EAVSSAECVVVLWSRASVQSDWVIEEAEEGRRRGILVPAVIEDVQIPLGFRRIEAAELADWDGLEESSELSRFTEAIVAMLGPAPAVVGVTDSRPTADEPAGAEEQPVADAPFAGPDVDSARLGVLESDFESDSGSAPRSEPDSGSSEDAPIPPIQPRGGRMRALWRRRSVRIAAVALPVLIIAGFVFWNMHWEREEYDLEESLARLKGFKVDIYYDTDFREDEIAAREMESMLLNADLVRDVVLVPVPLQWLDQVGDPDGYEIRYHRWSEFDVGWLLWKLLNEHEPSWEVRRKRMGDLRTRNTVSVLLFTRAGEGGVTIGKGSKEAAS
ncbi:toll/interleukin-1 receptor domain-containing protein, partial [bacterium]|nr:toll/interleukin-1 receptor domain-containing protein [bacterium]